MHQNASCFINKVQCIDDISQGEEYDILLYQGFVLLWGNTEVHESKSENPESEDLLTQTLLQIEKLLML